MKNKLRQLIWSFCKFLSYIFPSTFFNFVIKKCNLLYTFFISEQLKSHGSDIFFAYPLYLKGGKYIKIGTNVGFDQRLRLDAIDEFMGDTFNPILIIGDNVSIQKDCHIGAINKIVIGNNVLLASKVYISDHSHGEVTKEALLLPPAQRKLYSKGPVIIEDNVWLGEGVVVLPNVIIGENSIVGANAVVTKSIPKNSVVGGNPARIIRELK
jgi:acetyltransferase-like isoleucine patch superfamily enzyme